MRKKETPGPRSDTMSAANAVIKYALVVPVSAHAAYLTSTSLPFATGSDFRATWG